MLVFTVISSIPPCDFEHSSMANWCMSLAVLPDGVEDVGVDGLEVEADFLLTPPPSPKHTTAEPEVKQALPQDGPAVTPQDGLAVQAQAGKAVANGLAEWRRSAPCWKDWQSFAADVGLTRRPTSGHKNLCLYFSYLAWSQPDLSITKQQSRCACGGRAFRS
jgi:hypothetical protein